MLRRKENKLLITWIMSYLLVIVISVSISGGILAYSLGAQKKELEQNNRIMFEMVQNRTDTMFELMQNIALSFENDQKFQNYLEAPEPSISDTYEIINAIANASVSTVSYNMIGGIYLYVPDGDYVLNDLGKYPSLDFYKNYHKSDAFPYQQWRELMSQSHNHEYQTMYYQMGGRIEASGICMLHTLGTESHDATLVVVLNSKMIEELLASTWPNTKVEMDIFDTGGQRVFRYGGEEGAVLDDVDIRQQIESKQGMYTLKSTITMFQYRFLYPSGMFRDLYIKVYVVFILMILAFSGLAVVATSHYAKKNYSSLQRVAQLIEKNVKTKIQMDDQVYAYMEQELQDTFERYRSLCEEVEAQDRQMQRIFVTNLLTHSKVSHDSVTEHLKKFNVSLLSENFYVAIFYVVDASDIFFEKNKGEYDDQLHLANFIIENITTELLSEKFLVLSGEIDDVYTAIINLPQDSGGREEMVRIFRESIQFISKEFGFFFKVCLSSREQGLVNAHNAYKNASYTLDYSLTVASDEILFYDEIGEMVSYSSTDLISVQEKYTDLMQCGNFEDAAQVLEPMFCELETGNLSLEMLKCKTYALMNLISEAMRMVSKVNHDISQEYAEQRVAEIFVIRTIPALHEAHNRILTEMQDITGLKGNDKNARLIERVQAYIRENYNDCNMSVSSLAEQFKLNSLYFSRLFTKHTGVYISNYITQIRVERVKELLVTTDDTITAIAGKTGFYSDVVLIRSFKKIVGTTPGKYRTKNKEY